MGMGMGACGSVYLHVPEARIGVSGWSRGLMLNVMLIAALASQPSKGEGRDKNKGSEKTEKREEGEREEGER